MLRNTFLLCFIAAPFLSAFRSDKIVGSDPFLPEYIQTGKVEFVKDSVNRKIDVTIDGAFFTSYRYDGKTPKPVLYPILTKSGKAVTRGFPYETRANERVDHPHHVGYWFNYGDVNGLDFWNNSYAIPENEKNKYGTIFHEEILAMDEGKGQLTFRATWRDPAGIPLIEETTRFTFAEEGGTRYIDRETKLKALHNITFTDNKEGLVAIRVARALELPTDKPDVFTDSEGKATEMAVLNNEGVTGNYLGSEGEGGEAVWGTRNKWVRLSGTIEGETISIAMIDHPGNVGFPTYWHARGYGLFAANPLGQSIFSEGKQSLNFKLGASESVVFKYRMMIHSRTELTKEAIQKAFIDFGKN